MLDFGPYRPVSPDFLPCRTKLNFLTTVLVWAAPRTRPQCLHYSPCLGRAQETLCMPAFGPYSPVRLAFLACITNLISSLQPLSGPRPGLNAGFRAIQAGQASFLCLHDDACNTSTRRCHIGPILVATPHMQLRTGCRCEEERFIGGQWETPETLNRKRLPQSSWQQSAERRRYR